MTAERPAAGAEGWRDPVVLTIAAAVLALHLLVAGRYDFFRNELYFIVCGRHPAFGYADQPPLVPLIAAGTQLLGENLFLLRVPSALLAAALVPLAAAIAGLLGAGRPGRIVAAVAVIAAPGLTALTSTFGTSTPEPFGWTICAYFILRAASANTPAPLVWAGIAAGVTFEAKFGVALWAIGLACGLAATPFRALLRTRAAGLGLACAVAIAAPALLWQAWQGWPFREIVAHHAAEGRFFSGGPIRFWITQALAMNILLAPLWIAGLIAPWFVHRLAAGRIVSVAFAINAAAIFLARGKDYYLFPAYPALLAVGAAACARLRPWARFGWFGLALANAALVAPLTLPLLEPHALRRYMRETGIRPRPNEAAGVGARITQVFSDEFGWRDLAAKVVAVYRALPDDARAGTGIFAWNYGEAAAIDVLARGAGLPSAMSGENQYFLWGPTEAVDLVLVNVSEDAWRPRCDSLEQVATFGAPLAMPYETDRPILLCRGVHPALSTLWPALKFRP